MRELHPAWLLRDWVTRFVDSVPADSSHPLVTTGRAFAAELAAVCDLLQREQVRADLERTFGLDPAYHYQLPPHGTR